MNDTIAVVVVTYNRKELLVQCLDALRRQSRKPDAIYIVDNASNDGTEDLLSSLGYIATLTNDHDRILVSHCFVSSEVYNGQQISVSFVKMNQNLGGAGGFYEGVKRAHQNGFGWIWLMDDDAEPDHRSLELLLKFREEQNVSALASLKISPDGVVQNIHRGYFQIDALFTSIVRPIQTSSIEGKDKVEIDHASFVGILIKCDAVSKIGYPKKEFFIHYDDLEYCFRLRSIGRILLIPGSKIIHKDAGHTKRNMRKFLWFPYEIVPYEKLWLRYYHSRNLVWVRKKYSKNKINFYIGLFYQLGGEIIATIIYQDHKIKRVLFLMHRTYDGLKGIFDNQKSKRILYNKNNNS